LYPKNLVNLVEEFELENFLGEEQLNSYFNFKHHQLTDLEAS